MNSLSSSWISIEVGPVDMKVDMIKRGRRSIRWHELLVFVKYIKILTTAAIFKFDPRLHRVRIEDLTCSKVCWSCPDARFDVVVPRVNFVRIWLQGGSKSSNFLSRFRIRPQTP